MNIRVFAFHLLAIGFAKLVAGDGPWGTSLPWRTNMAVIAALWVGTYAGTHWTREQQAVSKDSAGSESGS